MTKELDIVFDSTDDAGMIDLMNRYGDSKLSYEGTTTEGEQFLISIGHDDITTRVFQHNGWMRLNHYHREGNRIDYREETYER